MRFPLFVELEGKKALVVGAGRIGIRRIEALKSFGSRVTVIAPSVGKGFSSDGIEFIKKSFSDEDIRDDYFIAVAATNNRCVNKRIGGQPFGVCILFSRLMCGR